jgi:hypothetical protein
MGMPAVVTDVLAWVGKALEVFAEPPVVYFVGVALVSAVFGISKKVIPMRRK